MEESPTRLQELDQTRNFSLLNTFQLHKTSKRTPMDFGSSTSSDSNSSSGSDTETIGDEEFTERNKSTTLEPESTAESRSRLEVGDGKPRQFTERNKSTTPEPESTAGSRSRLEVGDGKLRHFNRE